MWLWVGAGSCVMANFCTLGFNLKTVASMCVTFLKPNCVLSLLTSPSPGRYCECFNYFHIGFNWRIFTICEIIFLNWKVERRDCFREVIRQRNAVEAVFMTYISVLAWKERSWADVAQQFGHSRRAPCSALSPTHRSPVHVGPSAADHLAQCCQVIPAIHVLNVANNNVYDSFEVSGPFYECVINAGWVPVAPLWLSPSVFTCAYGWRWCLG